MPEIHAFASGFSYYVVHLLVSFMVLIGGVWLYVVITPYKEISLIRDGNVAASIGFFGAVVGLAIPLGVCVAGSISTLEIVIWGALSLAIQLVAFRVIDRLIDGAAARIENGDLAAAIALVAGKLAVAIVLAGAIAA